LINLALIICILNKLFVCFFLIKYKISFVLFDEIITVLHMTWTVKSSDDSSLYNKKVVLVQLLIVTRSVDKTVIVVQLVAVTKLVDTNIVVVDMDIAVVDTNIAVVVVDTNDVVDMLGLSMQFGVCYMGQSVDDYDTLFSKK